MSKDRETRQTPEERFERYVDRLTEVVGHADRAEPLRAYCTGLILPGERKSVEPMAARIEPARVRQRHQSMHHFVADAPWSDEAVLAAAHAYALPILLEHGPIRVWAVDDTSRPKKGAHSVGVARQYCGQLGKRENCQVAVSLSIANAFASLPIAFRLYLPEAWTDDLERCRKAGVPEDVWFETKPEIALDQIEAALAAGVPAGVVVADAGYGTGTAWRDELTRMGLAYAVGVLSTTTVWPEGTSPLPPAEWTGRGHPPTALRRDADHQPVTVKDLAMANASTFRRVSWRAGASGELRGRFWRTRVRAANRDERREEVRGDEWLLVEWPEGEMEPTRYVLSTMPKSTSLTELVHVTKLRWRIERDYEELKQELGLNHFEGRGWRGFHHHAALTIAAYAFLVAERGRFSPSGAARRPRLQAARVPEGFRPRGAPDPARAAQPDLDRDDAPATRGRAHEATPEVPVLSANAAESRGRKSPTRSR